jgi:competence protein ComEA
MAVKEENQPQIELWQKVLASAKTLRFEVIVVFLAFVLVLVGVYLLKSPGKDEGITIIGDQAVSETGDITVDIAGAVEKPGVYTLKDGTRMAEAIEKAGGFTSFADTEWISKTANMAVKLSDAAKIYIPQKGEKMTNVLGSDTQSGVININSATESELDKLSGVGPVTAQKIIDGRPYSNLSDLVAKKILTQKAFDKIKDQISVF